MSLMFWKKKPEKPKTVEEIAAELRKSYSAYIRGLNWEALGGEPEMQWVYTDREGNNYYLPKNIWQGVSRDRLAVLESAGIDVESRMQRPAMIERLRAIMEQCKRGQMGEVEGAYEAYKLTYEMHEVVLGSPSEVALMEYAVHLIYTDGENPQKLSPGVIQEKRTRAARDIELRAFFLDMAKSITDTSLPNWKQDGLAFSPPQNPSEAQEKRKEASRSVVSRFLSKSEQKKKSSQGETPNS